MLKVPIDTPGLWKEIEGPRIQDFNFAITFSTALWRCLAEEGCVVAALLKFRSKDRNKDGWACGRLEDDLF